MADSMTDGILLIDKPEGITSARAVAIVKRAAGRPKVGHLGTLDPMATGLLPLCLGQATKAAPYLNLADKGYEGTLLLGRTTDTLDVTGKTLSESAAPDPSTLDLESLAEPFRGDILQQPPAFSAIKRGGVRAYELARAGETPELEPRPVRVDRLELTPGEGPRLNISASCSKGTYVRSLVRDIGEAIGCGATLESLRRTVFGPFVIADSVPLDTVEEGGVDTVVQRRIPLLEALSHLPLVELDSAQARAVQLGRQDALVSLHVSGIRAEQARLAFSGRLVAVAGMRQGQWKLERVFPQA